MGYYVRILTPTEHVASVGRIKQHLSEVRCGGKLVVEVGGDEDWTHLSLTHDDDTPIASISRDFSAQGDFVAGEIEEFLEEISDAKPESAVAWLAEYLATVKTIYAFQLLHGTDLKNGWDIFGAVKNSVFSQVGGILQADGEGFTDEDGYHILWQFSKSVKGLWWMAVLQNGEWVRFQMDLGDKQHRAAFLRGEVPAGIEPAEFDD